MTTDVQKGVLDDAIDGGGLSLIEWRSVLEGLRNIVIAPDGELFQSLHQSA